MNVAPVKIEKDNAMGNSKIKLKVLISLIALQAVTASAGEITCTIERRGTYDQKVILLEDEGKVYALNGQARQRAEKRGWIDGKTVFEPMKLQKLIDEGVKKCETTL